MSLIVHDPAFGAQRNVKKQLMNSSELICFYVSVLPLVVGLTGAISADIGLRYDAPLWNLKIGLIGCAAGILACCGGVHSYAFSALTTVFGASWLAGAYAQKLSPFVAYGDKQEPVYTVFLMVAMLGVLLGLCCGIVSYVSHREFTQATVAVSSDAEVLKRMHNVMQPISHQLVGIQETESIYNVMV